MIAQPDGGSGHVPPSSGHILSCDPGHSSLAPLEALGELGELIHQAAKKALNAIEVMSLPLIGRPRRVRITRPAMPSRRAPDGSPHASPERPAVARSFTRSVGRQSSFQRQRDAYR